MDSLSLEFQGVRDLGLLATVMTAVALALAGYGAAQLIRGRLRRGLLCLAAAAPTAIVLLLAGRIGPGAWMAAMGLQIALAVGVFYAAVYAYLGRRRIAVLMIMRCAAIAALLLVLFKPAVSVVPDAASLRPRLPVLVDRSGSMATADQPASFSRYGECVREIRSQQQRLAQSFRPAYYHFAGDLDAALSPEGLERLQPAGEGTEVTDIAGAIGRCAAGFVKSDLGGMLLFTDGIHNAATDLSEALRRAGVPVYAIGVGSKTEGVAGRRDLQILSVGARFDAVKNDVASIDVGVRAVGLAGVPAEVQLLEEGNVVASCPVRADQDVSTVPCELKWTPRDAPGGSAATASASARPPDVRRLKVFLPPAPGEAATGDNEAHLHILVTERKIRTLYVEGTIRPEYKFLWRALNMDPQVQLISLVRVRRNEFSVAGSIQGKTLSDLPRTEDDFRLFDVIVLGDIDATFFTADQLARLRKFVADGGGLLMLGGHNSFGPGGYGGTDVEAAMPVLVGPRSQGQETTPMLPLLTADGARHPILSGVADYLPSASGPPKAGLPRLPDLLGCVKVVSAKPGASVLAVHPANTNEIVLAVQPFGAGRSAAFTADTTWQWFMTLQGKGEESPYRLFWGQLLRWLAGQETKSRAGAGSLVLRLDAPFVKAGAEVKISARVLDERGQTASGAAVTCAAESAAPPSPEELPGRPPRVETVTLTFREASGLFEGAYRPRKEGRYVLRARAEDPAARKVIASDELPLAVWPTTTETDTLARDEGRLRYIADRTGGRYADLSGLPEIIDLIASRQTAFAPSAPQGTTRLLYNFPLLLVLFVALLTGEWLLRRNWQLH